MKRLLLASLVLWQLLPTPAVAGSPPALVTTPSGLYEIPPVAQMPASHASSPDPLCVPLRDRDPFTEGALSFQFMSGYSSMTSIGPGGPSVDYATESFRLGYMLNTPQGDGCWYRGAWEVLLEYDFFPISREFGHYFTGPAALIRYNWVQPEWSFVPYLQGGAGVVLTDTYKWPGPYQELLGGQMEFLLRAEVGLRFMFTENLSFDIEAGFQHISNACLDRRNGGINNVGGSVGLTYYLGRP